MLVGEGDRVGLVAVELVVHVVVRVVAHAHMVEVHATDHGAAGEVCVGWVVVAMMTVVVLVGGLVDATVLLFEGVGVGAVIAVFGNAGMLGLRRFRRGVAWLLERALGKLPHGAAVAGTVAVLALLNAHGVDSRSPCELLGCLLRDVG